MVSTDSNTQADFVSKIRECDDWQLTSQSLEFMWGPHSLDCFASYCNAKTRVFFFSRFWNPGTAGVDAFFSVMGRGELSSSSTC